MPLPDLLAEKPTGFVVVESKLTYTQARSLGDKEVNRRLDAINDVLGSPIDVIAGKFPADRMQRYIEGELVSLAVIPVEIRDTPYQAFAARGDLPQAAVAEGAEKITFEDILRFPRPFVYGLLEEQERGVAGDVAIFRPSDRYIREHGEKNALVSMVRLIGILQHDCELDIGWWINPREAWMTGLNEGIREGNRILRHERDSGIYFELKERGYGVPLHFQKLVTLRNMVQNALDQVNIRPSEKVFISSTGAEATPSTIVPADLFNPTALVQWDRTEEILEQVKTVERSDLNVDRLRQLVAAHANRKTALLGLAGVGGAAGIVAVLWKILRHK